MDELDKRAFLEIVQNAPLVSIDLFLRNEKGGILLGVRKDAPARGFWFVPGGRIRKDQTLAEAFRAIAKREAGIEVEIEDARFMGVFEHFYDDNVEGLPGIKTQYISLAFEVRGVDDSVRLSDADHSTSRWRGVDFVLKDPPAEPGGLLQPGRWVHPYVKRMFEEDPAYPPPTDTAVALAQYDLVANRRNTTNNLLWQSPVLSLTAQAFLFTVALNPDVGPMPRLIAATLALVVALASVQLLIKHRSFERLDAKWLSAFESRYQTRGFQPVSERKELDRRLEQWAASKLWIGVLLLFGAAAASVLVYVVSTIGRS